VGRDGAIPVSGERWCDPYYIPYYIHVIRKFISCSPRSVTTHWWSHNTNNKKAKIIAANYYIIIIAQPCSGVPTNINFAQKLCEYCFLKWVNGLSNSRPCCRNLVAMKSLRLAPIPKDLDANGGVPTTIPSVGKYRLPLEDSSRHDVFLLWVVAG
jgi:hypothetical protein